MGLKTRSNWAVNFGQDKCNQCKNKNKKCNDCRCWNNFVEERRENNEKHRKKFIEVKKKEKVNIVTDENSNDKQFLVALRDLCTLNKLSEVRKEE